MEEEKILKLRKPVTLGGDTYTELRLREPTAGDLKKASAAPGNVAASILLIAIVANVPPAAVEQLCQRDFMAADAFLSGFSEPSPTGETSSSS